MKDENKTKKQLIGEMVELRQRISELEKSKTLLFESEERCMAMFEQTSDCIYVADASTKQILQANQALQRLLDYSFDEVTKLTVYDFVAHEREDIDDKIKHILKSKPYFMGERLYRRKDGSLVNVEVNVSLISYGGSKALFGIARDITERKQLQKAWQESEERYQILIENSFDGIFIHENFEILELNQQMADISGYDRSYLIGKSAIDLFTPESQKHIHNYIDLGKRGYYELELQRSDGRKVLVETFGAPCKFQGRDVRIVAIRDITERKSAEQQVMESEKRYRELYEGSIDGYALMNMEGTIIESNTSYKEMLGYTDEELIKKTYKDITPSKWHSLEEKIIESQAMERGYSDVYEKEYIRKDGTVFPITIRTHFVKDKNGNPIARWVFLRDITERRRAQERIQESESRFRGLVENSPIGIWQDDINQRTVYANKAILDMLEIENPDEITGKNWRPFFTQESLEIIEREHKKRIEGISSHYEVEIIGKRGSRRTVIVYANPLFSENSQFYGTIATFFDVTERKKMEKEITKRVKELEDFYKMAVGREMKMIELKEEIEKLKEELGKYKK